jgi:hypothetical protein
VRGLPDHEPPHHAETCHALLWIARELNEARNDFDTGADLLAGNELFDDELGGSIGRLPRKSTHEFGFFSRR